MPLPKTKEEKLRRLYEYRASASRRGDIISLARIQTKIDELEKEIINIRMN